MKCILKIITIIMICFIFTGCNEKEKINSDAGDTASISLVENASTGYSWSYVIANKEVLYVKNSEYVYENDEGLAGVSGLRNFVLSGLKEGKTTITFNYARSFETVDPIYTLVYTLNVDSSNKIAYIKVSGTYSEEILPVPIIK